MQIVIDIPKGIYEDMQRRANEIQAEGYTLENAVLNGVPLPKGHGRLIDADAFIKQESCCGYIEDMDIDYFKQNTPTIIEADERK